MDVPPGCVHGPSHVRVVMPVALQDHVEVPGQVPVLDPQVEGGVGLLHRAEELRGEDLGVEERGEAHPVIRPQPLASPELRLPSLHPGNRFEIRSFLKYLILVFSLLN